MQNSSDFKLIDGYFTAADANTILTTLINYKVDYHNREDFSNHIRFNKDPEHSKKRISQLLESKDNIHSFLSEALSQNLKLKINGVITITVEE